MKLMIDFFLKRSHIILIVTISFFTMGVIERLNDIGIFMNLVSLDTLSIMIEIIFQNILLALNIIVFNTIILSISLIWILMYALFKNNCNIRIIFIDYSKSLAVTIFLLLPFAILVDYFFTDYFDVKNQSLRTGVAIKYMSIVREPSIRVIKYNKKPKTILMLGKDDKFIYYLNSSSVKQFLKDINNTICKEKETQYFGKIVDLLLLTKKKDEKIENYSIASYRYLIQPINKVEFVDIYPSFDKSFCETNITINKFIENK